MTPEAQRIAIAEAMGAKHRYRETIIGPELVLWVEAPYSQTDFWKQHRVRNPEEVMGSHDLPNYLNDLNAMHEAEESNCFDLGNQDYVKNLCFVVFGAYPEKPSNITLNFYALKRIVRATAAQRAEAFLRTLNKWEDSA